MRILHLAGRLSARGGCDQHLHAIVHELRARDHDNHLAVGMDDGTALAPCAVTLAPGLDASAARPVALEPLVDRLRPDVIHLHAVVNPWVLEWAAAHPSLLTVQDHRHFCPGRGKWTLAGGVCREPMARGTCAACFDDAGYFGAMLDLTRRRLAAAAQLRLVVLSRYMADELACAGIPEQRIRVVPPFVHGLVAPGATGAEPCVLFVGRLVAAKGVAEAIAAWRASGVALPLVMAGTGPLRSEAEAAGARVLGWLDRSTLAGWYREARALVMPSRWQEPFGLAGLEALSFGVPVVAWDSGGIREWHSGPGLVAWGDVPGLAAALRGAVGARVRPRPGFEKAGLTRRLLDTYAEVSSAGATAALG